MSKGFKTFLIILLIILGGVIGFFQGKSYGFNKALEGFRQSHDGDSGFFDVKP